MKEVCYIITAYRDPYELPLACFDDFYEVCRYVGVLPRQIYRHLAGKDKGLVPHVKGYVVHRVEL